MSKSIKKTKLKSYHIETNGSLNFFTEAESRKKALANLIKNSFDFRRILSDDCDLLIKVTEIK